MHLSSTWDARKAKGALVLLSMSSACWAIAIGFVVLH
ncbi:hypothetical protein C8J44_2818 [Sphingomonas sp. PP-CE-3A-406]|nr:hypothetical protein C8J44_2818 [Sphingomonas sp. PP-CE-3A-406]TCP72959.1 hypothetical protein C8J43_101702 [Sphingomonas sp. PP-CE-1G-424]